MGLWIWEFLELLRFFLVRISKFKIMVDRFVEEWFKVLV